MNLPPYTALQFAVIAELIPGEMEGRDLRKALREKHGIKRSGPSFYNQMSRLEEAGQVKGEYRLKEVGDQHVRARWYKLTGKGTKDYNKTREFYSDTLQVGGAAAAG
ncbi:MAG: hypothetical protein AAGH92_13245 [Planctomycetota bacterium]